MHVDCFHPYNFLLTDTGYSTFFNLAKRHCVFNTKRDAVTIIFITNLGFRIITTPDHKILTVDGPKQMKDIAVGDTIQLPDLRTNFPKIDDIPRDEIGIDFFLMGCWGVKLFKNPNGKAIFLKMSRKKADRIGPVIESVINLLYDKYGNEDETTKTTFGNRKFAIKPCYWTGEGYNQSLGSAFLGRRFAKRYDYKSWMRVSVPDIVMKNCLSRAGLYYLSGLFSVSGYWRNSKLCVYSLNLDLLHQFQLMLHAHGAVFGLRAVEPKDWPFDNQYKKICKNKQLYELYSTRNGLTALMGKIKIFDEELAGQIEEQEGEKVLTDTVRYTSIYERSDVYNTINDEELTVNGVTTWK